MVHVKPCILNRKQVKLKGQIEVAEYPPLLVNIPLKAVFITPNFPICTKKKSSDHLECLYFVTFGQLDLEIWEHKTLFRLHASSWLVVVAVFTFVDTNLELVLSTHAVIAVAQIIVGELDVLTKWTLRRRGTFPEVPNCIITANMKVRKMRKYVSATR